MAPGGGLLGCFGCPNPGEGTGTGSTRSQGLQIVAASLGRGVTSRAANFDINL